MTAPSIKEALEAARQFIENGVELGYIKMPDADTPDPAHKTLSKIIAALATLSPPVGERRDAIAVKQLEWSVEDDNGRDMHRSRTDTGQVYTVYDDGFSTPPYRLNLHQLHLGSFDIIEVAKAASQADYEKRIRSAIHASGLVQDEAAIRADEREKCAKIADREAEFWQDAESSSARIAAAAIRSRDGGAES